MKTKERKKERKEMRDLSAAKKILLIRALSGLAWVDGRIDPGERVFLDRMCERLQLDETSKARLDEMLAVPISAPDAERLLRDLARGVFNKRERRMLLRELRALAIADGDFSKDERRFFSRIEASMNAGWALRRLIDSDVDKDGTF